MFNDFTRECLTKIEVYPVHITSEMMSYCSSDKHLDCPFYKILNTKEVVCQHILKCSAFRNFHSAEFKNFVALSSKYCTSKNHLACQRFILKEKGGEVPITLHPDGTHIAEWGAAKATNEVK